MRIHSVVSSNTTYISLQYTDKTIVVPVLITHSETDTSIWRVNISYTENKKHLGNPEEREPYLAILELLHI